MKIEIEDSQFIKLIKQLFVKWAESYLEITNLRLTKVNSWFFLIKDDTGKVIATGDTIDDVFIDVQKYKILSSLTFKDNCLECIDLITNSTNICHNNIT